MASKTLKTFYTEKKKKPEYFEDFSKEDMTDQSQHVQASIVEMAKKFGIDAIIAKAEAMEIEKPVQDILFGHDLTQGFTSREELLNTKKRLTNTFLNIPARIRKNMFNDDINEFVNAYTYNDEKKLEELNKIGLVSGTQLSQVKQYNKNKAAELKEIQLKENFVKKMEEISGGLYETFKNTGNISINNIANDATSDKNVQNDISSN